MKYKVLLIALIPMIAIGCQTAYKSGHTPDDLYYAPMRGIAVGTDEDDDNKKVADRNNQSDRQLRMQRYDRRWRSFDDEFNWNYNPYVYGFSCGYYYNPFYYPFPIFLNTPVKNPKLVAPRTANLRTYQLQRETVVNPKTGNTETIYRANRYNQSNNGRQTRETFTPSNPSRNYSPSSSGGRVGSSPVSRPGR